MGSVLIIYALLIVFLALGGVFSHRPRKRKRISRPVLVYDQQESSRENPEPPANMPIYSGRQNLLTKMELSFYRALKKAAGEDYIIMCQVSLRQVIRVRPMNPFSSQSAFDRISRETLDFVLCEAETLSVVAALALDDKSRRRSDRVYLNQFLSQVMKDAGIPLLRFPAASGYTAEQVWQQIAPLKHMHAA